MNISIHRRPADEPAKRESETGRVSPIRNFGIPIEWSLTVLLIAAVALTFTRAPWWDEGAFADPAENLAHHGTLGATTWHPAIAGLRDFPEIDRYTYWTPPGYVTTLGLWFKLFGFSIFSLRAYSIVWGLLLVFAWYRITRALTGNELIARVAALLIAADHAVVMAAATGRPDAMVASLGSLGLYAYLHWRESSLSRAAFAGAAFAAASVLCHPMGLLYVLDLGVMAIVLDRRRIRIRHAGLAIVPFLTAGLAWGLYIMKAPDIFRLQFFGHVGSRAGGLHSPLRAVLYDLKERYQLIYWHDLPGLLRARVLILVAYGAGLLLLVSRPRTWRDPRLRLLALLPPMIYVATAILDGAKYPNYFIHIFPVLCAGLAAAVCFRIPTGSAASAVTMTGLTVLLALQFGGNAIRIAQNTNTNVYRPVIDFLKTHATPESRIIGTSELMFGLGRNYHLSDDQRLGIYTGEGCDFIVRSPFTRGPLFYDATEPETAEKLRRKYKEFDIVFQRGDLRVYARKPAFRSEK